MTVMIDTAIGNSIIVAGSTHPGEERHFAAMHRRLREGGRASRLVVVPRHPARADTVEARDDRTVHLHVPRQDVQALHGPAHREQARLQDVQAVYFRHVGPGNRLHAAEMPAQTLGLEQGHERVSEYRDQGHQSNAGRVQVGHR